jgi:hypothetical protein
MFVPDAQNCERRRFCFLCSEYKKTDFVGCVYLDATIAIQHLPVARIASIL